MSRHGKREKGRTTRGDHPATRPARQPTRRQWGIAAGLVLVTALAYLPASRGQFLWDDPIYVADNPMLRSASGLWDIWTRPARNTQYYPLTFTSFWLEYQIWADNPRGYHLTNIALHAGNALLVWRLMAGLNVPGAPVVAALFALHPVHAESVAWISQRKNLLSGVFSLFAVLIWLRFAETGRRSRYAGATLLYSAAMLSKTTTALLPVIFAVLAWWKAPSNRRRRALAALPLLAVGGGLGLVTVWREHLYSNIPATIGILSPTARLLIAGRAFWFYVVKLAWPFNLMTVYPRWPTGSATALQYLYPIAALATLAGAAAAARYRPRGAAQAWFVALLAYLSLLAPTLGFIDFDYMRFSYVADHFAYLPSIPLLALAVAGLTRLARRLWPKRRLASVATLAVATCLFGATRERAEVYKDSETLWRDNLAKNADAWVAHYNLGTILYRQGRSLEEATRHFAATVRLRPTHAKAYSNWAAVLELQGKIEEARRRLEQAVRLAPRQAIFQGDLGSILLKEGKLSQAREHLKAALRLDPGFAPAHSDLGIALYRQGRFKEAVSHLRAAVRLDPSRPSAYNNLAAALAREGLLAEAIDSVRTGLRLAPGNAQAHFNLALFLIKAGRTDDAQRQLAIAVRLAPRFAEAHFRLGKLLADQGKTREAIRHYREAVRLQPQHHQAQRELKRSLSAAPPRERGGSSPLQSGPPSSAR